MTPEGSNYSGGRFYTVLTEAVAEFTEHGFDSQERLDFWMKRIEDAARDSLIPLATMEREIRSALQAAYARQIERGAILRRHPGVARFTLEQVKPKLRAELDRRIMANAQLIKLHRAEAVETTLRRFSGWATSIPAGGSRVVERVQTKTGIRKALAQLPFEDRRCAIDQGHKFVADLDRILAVDAGALAAVWHSHFRQAGYNYRVDHKERDGRVYLLRGCWGMDRGLIKAGPAGYTDQITAPAEEVFCRCYYEWLYALRDLPDIMLTEKGRLALSEAQRRVA
jgi:hypothetical protein